MTAELETLLALAARCEEGSGGDRVEREFAVLLAQGWPEKVARQPKPTPTVRFGVLDLMRAQLPDSRVPETRFYWRKKFGVSDEIATDPRPFAEALAAKEPNNAE